MSRQFTLFSEFSNIFQFLSAEGQWFDFQQRKSNQVTTFNGSRIVQAEHIDWRFVSSRQSICMILLSRRSKFTALGQDPIINRNQVAKFRPGFGLPAISWKLRAINNTMFSRFLIETLRKVLCYSNSIPQSVPNGTLKVQTAHAGNGSPYGTRLLPINWR